jgi:hypothetical protein
VGEAHWQRIRLCQFLFERANEQGQRRAEFMTDVAEECRLRAIEFRQCFSPLPFRLVRAGVRERDGKLIGDQIEEAPVAVVKGSPWIDSDDQACRSSAGR